MLAASQTITSPEAERRIDDILRVLMPFRRSDDHHDREFHSNDRCFAPQIYQLQPFITDSAPVLFTLPAFPCKSPNDRKVLGHLPDMGERASLRFLQRICHQIEIVYPFGARIVICSDGHVFGDLIHVPDDLITEYGMALREMAEEEGASALSFFSLEDVYGQIAFNEKRERLSEQYAEPVAALREQLRTDEQALALYRGITKFLVEDSGSAYAGTKTALQRDCRQRAYCVIQRSRAWSNLVVRHFPRSFRLSIHPQPCRSAKFGISLLESADTWMTPWHSVAVQRPDGTLILMKRSDAEKAGRLVHVNGTPSHYIVGEQDVP